MRVVLQSHLFLKHSLNKSFSLNQNGIQEVDRQVDTGERGVSSTTFNVHPEHKLSRNPLRCGFLSRE
jgi:hypothetical protein